MTTGRAEGWCSLSVPAQLVEEVVDDVQLAGAGHLVVDVLADREVEHAEAERARTPPAGRPGSSRRPAITSSSVPCRKSRLPVSCSARCGEVSALRQCSTSSTMLVEASRISGARSRSDTCSTSGLWSNHDALVDVRLARRRWRRRPGRCDRISCSALSCTVIRPAGAGPLQVAAEAGRAVGGQVVHADLVERPAGAGQEGVDVAGDQARSRRTRRASGRGRPRLSRSAASAAEAAVRVALMIELSRQANG